MTDVIPTGQGSNSLIWRRCPQLATAEFSDFLITIAGVIVQLNLRNAAPLLVLPPSARRSNEPSLTSNVTRSLWFIQISALQQGFRRFRSIQ